MKRHTSLRLRRRLLTLAAMLMMAAATSAQDLRVARVSLDTLLQRLPEYAEQTSHFQKLQQQFEAELSRAEEEFNRKYEDFLDGQRDFAPSILKKRQAELQSLMNSNISFKEQTSRQLAADKAAATAALRQRVRQAVADYARNEGYAYVLNSDADALPYADDAVVTDITDAVAAHLSHR